MANERKKKKMLRSVRNEEYFKRANYMGYALVPEKFTFQNNPDRKLEQLQSAQTKT